MQQLYLGTDVTRYMRTSFHRAELMECLASRYTIGYIGSQSFGCTIYNALMAMALVTIIGLITTRFFMAFIFHWFISPGITDPSTLKVSKTNRKGVGYLYAPANSSFNASNELGQHEYIAPWARSLALPTDLHTIMLVTCYSEDEKGIYNTLNSLASTDYPNDRKLLLVICDGLVQGKGNSRKTPEIVLGMIDLDERMGISEKRSYEAIADGKKRHNMARVVLKKYNISMQELLKEVLKDRFP
jgi:chitin synthase